MQKLKIAYFGSPSFSATLLEKIINDKDLPVEVKLVITQPDMPVGRKQTLTPTPVKVMAEKYQLSIVNENLNIENSMKIENWLLKIKKCDLALVYAYGEILPKEILDLPKLGFWNVHPSLLPKYRGASPIAYPLILGDKITGVSLILMDEKMDHGPIIAQEEMEIKPEDTRTGLENKLTDLSYKMLCRVLSAKNADFLFGHLRENHRATLPNFFALAGNKKDEFKPTNQNHSQATYTQILKKSDGFIPLLILKKCLNNEPIKLSDLPFFLQTFIQKYSINFSFLILNSKFLILNLFRGLSPWPGLWTTVDLRGQQLRLKILGMELHDNQLTLTKVQLENKNPVDFKTFNNAYQLFAT